MSFIKNPVKGMCDILPSDMRLRESVLNLIKQTYARHGFEQIETPAMEPIENLLSKQGGDNEKLIFKVMKNGAELARALDKGDPKGFANCGMRYDLTVPLARYYASNASKLMSPFKALQIGSVWRGENPQKGRFRQFTQCDIDILGDDSSFAEIELVRATVNMLCSIFKKFGQGDRPLKVHINDRRVLFAAGLKAGFTEEQMPTVLISLDKLDKIGANAVVEELSQKSGNAEAAKRYMEFYCGVKSDTGCREFCALLGNYLQPAVSDGLSEIIECCARDNPANVEVVFDPALVRGMGYYTGTIFEITTQGYNFSIAGGGRYDKMIGKFTGNDVCAAGFSIGFERIITILRDNLNDDVVKIAQDGIAFLIEKGASSDKKLEIFSEAQKLRDDGRTVTVAPMKKNLKFQIDELQKTGYTDIRRIYKN